MCYRPSSILHPHKAINKWKFVIPPGKIRSQDGPFSTASHQWMKCWNGWGSAFLHGNCVRYCHDNLQQRRKKNKTRNEGKQWKGVIKDDRTSPDRFSLSTSSSDSSSSARAHLVSWITERQICQSSLLHGPLSGRCCFTNGVIQVWKTVSH